MKRFHVVIMFPRVFISIFVLSFVAGRPSDVKDASKVVDSVIQELDEYISKKNLTVLKLPDVDDSQFLVKKFFRNGVLKDLSTVVRLGNATINPQTSGGEMIHWVVQSNIGLESLALEYDFHLETFFGLIYYNGHLTVQVDSNVLDVETTVVTNKNGRFCSLVVNDLAVTKLDDFNVTISRKGFLKLVLENMLFYLFSYVVPMFREGINNQIHEFIRTYPMNPEITNYICKYFNPKYFSN